MITVNEVVNTKDDPIDIKAEIYENTKETSDKIFRVLFLNKYREDEKTENIKRESGYSCIENNDCISELCIDKKCYIEEKDVDLEDLRSSGNPCLYNSQCKTNNCIENVCEDEYIEERVLDSETEKYYHEK